MNSWLRNIVFVFAAICCPSFDRQLYGMEKDLFAAIKDDNYDRVSDLIGKGARVDVRDDSGDTLLHRAVFYNTQIGITKLLCEQPNAPINAPNSCNNTPLHLAVMRMDRWFADVLCAHGALTNVQNYNGDTPLHLAARDGKIEIVELLYKHGALIAIPNKAGNKPLHMAAEYGRIEIAEWLCAHGARINAQNKDGDTPLHLAVKNFYGDLTMVELLCRYGAFADVQDNDGRTPLDLVNIYDYRWEMRTIRHFLREHDFFLRVYSILTNAPVEADKLKEVLRVHYLWTSAPVQACMLIANFEE